MNTTNNLKIIETSFSFNQDQVSFYKNQLKQLKGVSGIISLCLDENSLFVEYSKSEISTDSIINHLKELKFPMKEKITQNENKMLV